MTKKAPSALHTVSLIDLPESSASVLYSLYDILSSVGTTRYETTGENHRIPPFDVRFVASRRSYFRCTNGIPVSPHHCFSEVDYSDIVIVTDLMFPPDIDPRGRWTEATKWIRNVYDQGAIVCSICTGSIVLAEASLLDRQTATTHWSTHELFQRYYPEVQLVPERVLVPTGPDNRIITTGCAGAWEDLAFYLNARFQEEVQALNTVRVFALGNRSEAQLPFAAISKPRRHDDAIIADCQVWIAGHYAQSNPVEMMMKRAGLDEKTFKRRFRTATGYAPSAYLQTLRIEEAKLMLESQELPAEKIGQLVGYEDLAYFSRVFKKRTGVSPDRYRQQFRQIVQARG